MNIWLKNHLDTLRQAVDETIWPTRCAVCDKAGYLLCPSCARDLSYIDIHKSCPICGEPYGAYQCCNCNPISKNLSEQEKLNYHMEFKQSISVTRLDENTGRLIALYKDGGEQRLSSIIAYYISLYLPRKWYQDQNAILSFIPASKEAYSKRGFDHMELICKDLSKYINVSYLKIFSRPKSIDQRQLNRQERQSNLKNRFSLLNNQNIFDKCQSVILIDDVFTTGATLNSAAKILNNNQIKNVYCATFSRTF